LTHYRAQGTGYNVLIDVPYKAFCDAFGESSA
jgi:hypothetical protein